MTYLYMAGKLFSFNWNKLLTEKRCTLEKLNCAKSGAIDYCYRYNGKELDEATGHYFYGFRMYDPAICRFTGTDPLAAKFSAWSTYTYVLDNPVAFIDPTGMAPEGWSQGNIQAANHFGVFGNGGDGYSALFEEPRIVRSLRMGAEKIRNILINQGVDSEIVNASDKAFNDMLDNLLQGNIEIEAELKVDIGARLANYTKLTTGIPLVNWAKFSGDINFGSIEVVSVKGNWGISIGLDDFSFDPTLNANIVHPGAGNNVSFGAAASANALYLVGFSNEFSYTYQTGQLPGHANSINNTLMVKLGSLEYSINLGKGSVQVRNTFEYEKRYGIIAVGTVKVGTSVSGSADF